MTRTARNHRLLWWATSLGAAASILLSSAPSAGAAVTRLRVDWSAGSQGALPPRVHIFTEGSPTGWHTGRCAQLDGNCKADSGFRWEEANPGAGGEPQAISFVDDQPTKARQVCFEVTDAYAEDLPTASVSQANPPVSVVVTVTDPGGASRRSSFTLTTGQRADVDCTPGFRPRRALGARGRAPAWWGQARRLIRARGGKCSRDTSRLRASDPRTGRPAGTYTEVQVGCIRSVPRFLSARFGTVERCVSSVTKGNPEGDQYSHFCEVFSGSKRSSWLCQRFKNFDPRGRHVLKRTDRAWWARTSKRSSKYRVRSLKRCLTRRPGR